jgi:colanic acid biosynthesis glycosyl transferase WcaI
MSLNACDMAIITLVLGMSGVSVPRRMFNCFATGKPLIAATDQSSEIARLVHAKNLGWIIPPQVHSRMADAALQASRNRENVLLMSTKAHAVVQYAYSEESVINRFGSLFEESQQGPTS